MSVLFLTEANEEKLVHELIRDERMRLTAYKDSVGLWTIGVGHLIASPNDPNPRVLRITEPEALAWLAMDIGDALERVKLLVPSASYWSGDDGTGGYRPHNQSRQRALINMSFNLGHRLDHFVKFLEAINAGDWKTAAVEMMDSKWATQVGARAERLRDLILTDD